jgi:hypothetical protein
VREELPGSYVKKSILNNDQLTGGAFGQLGHIQRNAFQDFPSECAAPHLRAFVAQEQILGPPPNQYFAIASISATSVRVQLAAAIAEKVLLGEDRTRKVAHQCSRINKRRCDGSC